MQQQTAGPVTAPFIKWAGGKTQLLAELDQLVPAFSNYFEPFLGGGAMFFHLFSYCPRFKAYLSDANRDLINAYNVVKKDVERLIVALDIHAVNYRKKPEEYYYKLRSDQPKDDVAAAARFIALNKTCYNGLYRVNKSGLFNVPIGRYKNPAICDRNQLYNANTALNLSKATLSASDYTQALKKARDGDFVYLDPPFDPLSKTANFVDYTRNGFGESDQIKLAIMFKELDKRGCKVLLSNSDTELTKSLYRGFTQKKVNVLRAINCKGLSRKGYRELLIYNYKL